MDMEENKLGVRFHPLEISLKKGERMSFLILFCQNFVLWFLIVNKLPISFPK